MGRAALSKRRRVSAWRRSLRLRHSQQPVFYLHLCHVPTSASFCLPTACHLRTSSGCAALGAEAPTKILKNSEIILCPANGNPKKSRQLSLFSQSNHALFLSASISVYRRLERTSPHLIARTASRSSRDGVPRCRPKPDPTTSSPNGQSPCVGQPASHPCWPGSHPRNPGNSHFSGHYAMLQVSAGHTVEVR